MSKDRQILGEQVKPCPFCRSEKVMICEGKNHANCHVFWVECQNYEHCKVRPVTHQMGKLSQAIKIWNSRQESKPDMQEADTKKIELLVGVLVDCASEADLDDAIIAAGAILKALALKEGK
jgi:transcription elongation factor Elf1